MRARKKVNRGFIWIAFGAGCVVSCWFPAAWLAGVLAVAVIILGVCSCQR